MNIVIDRSIPLAEKLFKSLGFVQLIESNCISSHSLVKADALIIRSTTKITSKLLNKSKIKFVGTTTSGIDHVDTSFLKKSKINFAFAPGCNAVAVVEYVFSSLLWLSKRDKFRLHEKIVGIIGVGKIGNLLNQRLKAYGIHTLLCDPILELQDTSKPWKSLEYVIKHSNVLSIHVPLTQGVKHSTWHLINKDILCELSNGCIIINTSRGSVVDNSALLKILEKKKKISVVLDVWESEPKISLSLLSYVDIGTAHIAGHTLEGKIRGVLTIYKKLNSFLGNKDLNIDLMDFIPPFQIKEIKLSDSFFNEELFYILSRIIYDIKYDDMYLRHRMSTSSSSFLECRNIQDSYIVRREWSALNLNIKDKYKQKLFTSLGFSCKKYDL